MKSTQIVDIIIRAGKGAFTGAVLATLGYLKNMKREGAEFVPAKAAQTIVVGGFVGAGFGYLGLEMKTEADFQAAMEWASAGGLITVIEYIKKTAWAIIHPTKKEK